MRDDIARGIAAGKADLNDLGKVPAEQLPSYVDAIVEVENKAALPSTGQTGKIYAIKTGTGVQGDRKGDCYRWSGSQYVLIVDAQFYTELAKKQNKLVQGYGIKLTDLADETTKIELGVATFDLKGAKEYYADLPTTNIEGDTWYVKNDDADLSHLKGFYTWIEDSGTTQWLKIDNDTQWGKIFGDITKQSDLMTLLGSYLKRIDVPTSTTLTAAEREEITSGAIVSGTFLSREYPFFLPTSDSGSGIVYGTVISREGTTSVIEIYRVEANNTIVIYANHSIVIGNNGTLLLKKPKLATDLDANSHKITNLAAPTNTNDAVNKDYVDSNFVEHRSTTSTTDKYAYTFNKDGDGATKIDTTLSNSSYNLIANAPVAVAIESINSSLDGKLNVQTTTDDKTYAYGFNKDGYKSIDIEGLGKVKDVQVKSDSGTYVSVVDTDKIAKIDYTGKLDKVTNATSTNKLYSTKSGNQGTTDVDNDFSTTTDNHNLADIAAIKSFVNSSISANAADKVGKNASMDAFDTKADLIAGPWFINGVQVTTLKKNDYATVLKDETHDNKQCRWIYNGTAWIFDFIIGSTFTAAQQAAIDSTVTKEKVQKYDGYESGMEALEEEIDQEVLDRESGDELLNNKITDEQSARESGDLVLEEKINKKQNKLVAGSTNVHLIESGDETILKVDVSESGDFATKTELHAEQVARESGDEALLNKINREADLRESGDLDLQNQIDAEVSARESGDTELLNKINKEISDRESGDIVLDNKKQNKLVAGSTNVHLTESGDITILKVDKGGESGDYATKEELRAEIRLRESGDEQLENKKQDKLVNQVNIKSINGHTLLESGDLTISGEVVNLTATISQQTPILKFNGAITTEQFDKLRAGASLLVDVQSSGVTVYKFLADTRIDNLSDSVIMSYAQCVFKSEGTTASNVVIKRADAYGLLIYRTTCEFFGQELLNNGEHIIIDLDSSEYGELTEKQTAQVKANPFNVIFRKATEDADDTTIYYHINGYAYESEESGEGVHNYIYTNINVEGVASYVGIFYHDSDVKAQWGYESNNYPFMTVRDFPHDSSIKYENDNFGVSYGGAINQNQVDVCDESSITPQATAGVFTVDDIMTPETPELGYIGGFVIVKEDGSGLTLEEAAFDNYTVSIGGVEKTIFGIIYEDELSGDDVYVGYIDDELYVIDKNNHHGFDANTTLTLWFFGEDTVEPIDSRVIPIDGRTIKRKETGELYAVGGESGSGVWGGIEGDIEDQTDLQEQFQHKVFYNETPSGTIHENDLWCIDSESGSFIETIGDESGTGLPYHFLYDIYGELIENDYEHIKLHYKTITLDNTKTTNEYSVTVPIPVNPDLVYTNINQTIDSYKWFTKQIQVPEPIEDGDAVNKEYADTKLSKASITEESGTITISF